MSAGGCKLILDSDSLSAVGEAAKNSKAVDKMLEENKDALRKLGEVCSVLVPAAFDALAKEAKL